MPQIYEAIHAIMADIPAIGKDKRNQQQGFSYRGIDDVMNVMNPLLTKHGVFCVPEVIDRIRQERETKSGGILAFTTLTVKYTFYAKDGSSISSVVVGEGMDSGDKSTNKALSVAMKYAMFQVFCIPTEEMADPDAETPPSVLPGPTSDTEVAKGQPTGESRGEKIKNLLKKYGASKEHGAQCVSELKAQGLAVNKQTSSMNDGEFTMLMIQLEKRLKDAA